MAENSKIEWTDHTFNPWIGCTKVGPGCDHCYAENMMDHRYGTVRWGAGQPRQRTSEANWRKPETWNKVANGTRPRVFCASLADVFDNEVPDAWRSDLWRLIQRTPNLDWLLLTKRIGNAHRMLPAFMKPYPNLWIGTTVVNQEEADRDVPKLLDLPATVRFLSCEPLLGPVDLERWLQGCTCARYVVDTSDPEPYHPENVDRELTPGCPEHDIGLHWIIAGGESGAKARPAHPDWFRSLRDQCQAAGVPFLFKQWGEYIEANLGNINSRFAKGCRFVELDGTDSTDWTIDRFTPSTAHMLRVGKKRAGRMLDGRTWDQFPEATPCQ